MPIFDAMIESDVKFFENNAPDSARARKLLNKTRYTDSSTNEFSTIVKKHDSDGLNVRQSGVQKAYRVIR